MDTDGPAVLKPGVGDSVPGGGGLLLLLSRSDGFVVGEVGLLELRGAVLDRALLWLRSATAWEGKGFGKPCIGEY